MSSFFAGLAGPGPSQQSIRQDGDKIRTTTGYCDFLQFLAITFSEEQYRTIGLHPVITNTFPTFSDASMGGVSFDVRKVRVASFPQGLDDESLGHRTFVVVKQPRVEQDRPIQANALDEIATELQILRHTRHISNSNILELVGIVYHDANIDGEDPYIFPALVVEYAEFGDLRSFLAEGFGRSIQEKFEICRDVAQGLDHLHRCGIVHCDVKDTNMLVCASKDKKIVVKVSDFGFAISLLNDSPRVVGYTPYWEAPELHEPLQRTRLCQLDIYSYGLLLYTVMKNGALFYNATKTENQVSDILKMKTSNLLQATMRMNLLLTMKNERCMLLIICNILHFCLHADAGKRFSSMHDLLNLLRWCDPSDLRREYHIEEPRYQLQTTTIGEYMKTYYPETKNRVLNLFDQHVRSYQAAIEDDVFLGNALKSLFQERINIELDMFLDKPTGPDNKAFQYCNGIILMLYRSMLGLIPLNLNGKASTEAQDPSRGSNPGVIQRMNECRTLHFCQDLDTDLLEYHEVLRKFPGSVKRYIIMELEKLHKQIGDDIRRGSILNNLAYCYIEGFGIQPDFPKGLQLLHEAAIFGSFKARKHLVRIHAAKGSLDGLGQSTWVRWARESLEEGDKRALRVLQSLDRDAISRLKRQWATSRLPGPSEDAYPAHHMRPPTIVSTCGRSTWRARLLRLASTLNMARFAYRIISVDLTSMEEVNAYGQTPLILACQSGNLEVARSLLECGAEVGAADLDGFTSLHWLISFSDAEKRKLAPLLAGKSQDPDTYGTFPPNQSEVPAPNLQGGASISGTPLHWAVVCQDLVAVDVLITMGSRPSLRRGIEIRSALELACAYHEANIIDRMLREPSVKANAKQYQILGDGRLNINLMFWVVSGNSRFRSLVRLGTAFEKTIEETMGHLVKAGVATDAVLRTPPNTLMMSAPFATSYHQCHTEIMRAGLKNGFKPYIDTTCAKASSGGPAMSLAIADGDRDMFVTLLDAEASVRWRNIYGLSALGLAASETDDTFFVEKLLEEGVPINDPEDCMSPFLAATYKGHLKVATLLWDRGAKRDSRNAAGQTILGFLIQTRTRNAMRCIRFLLNLPDRDESDGFDVIRRDETQHEYSALHVALLTENANDVMSEDPEIIETSRVVVSLLLQKYFAPKYLNSHSGPHHDVPLGAAVEIGNYHVVRLLLEAGADPNAEDEYARRPLDKLYWRYCYPATLDYLKSVAPDDMHELAKRLRYVNQNTSEIMSLLKSYGAQPNVFRFPSWLQSDLGYRNVDWIAARLKEKRDAPPVVKSELPVWGDLPIRIPKKPMQLDEQRRLAEREADGQEGADLPSSSTQTSGQ